jgi:hypothetical protein
MAVVVGVGTATSLAKSSRPVICSKHGGQSGGMTAMISATIHASFPQRLHRLTFPMLSPFPQGLLHGLSFLLRRVVVFFPGFHKDVPTVHFSDNSTPQDGLMAPQFEPGDCYFAILWRFDPEVSDIE